MKTLEIPFISGLESLSFEELDKRMETGASKDFICEVNWQEYPYKPSAAVRVARSESHLVIFYDVKGLDLRAAALEDNGPVWEDSCCEFFVSHLTDGTYYNFELNCIGTLLAAKRRSRTDADMFSPDALARIIRHSSLERKVYEENDRIHAWSTALCIPFDLIGLDTGNLPSAIRANFYKCGDLTAHPHYLSWNRIAIPAPDFHRPDHFGELVFKHEA